MNSESLHCSPRVSGGQRPLRAVPSGPDVVPCQRCAGSGEGPVDGTVCLACHGRGEIDVGEHDADEARREDAYDAWREQLRDERECAGVSA